VLCNIATALQALLKRLRGSAASRASSLARAFRSAFVRPGATRHPSSTKVAGRSSLDEGTDWKMEVDYRHAPVPFPAQIYATAERPDIVMWSESRRRVVLLELTCPAEEGIQAARDRKEAKYASLVDSINAANNWRAELHTVEIGARGLVACHTYSVFRTLGFTHSEANTLCRTLSTVSARCSFSIHLAHKHSSWIPRDLVHSLAQTGRA
jgi:hypothetical protein